MRGIRRLAIAGAAAAGLLGMAPADDLRRLDGHYSRAFGNSDVNGDRYRSVDTLDIVRHDAELAYVSVHLEFFNGHSCDIDGIARLRPKGLVLAVPQSNTFQGECTVAITPGAGKLRLAAKGEGCWKACGTRGNLDGAALPIAGRRPITNRAAVFSLPEVQADLAIVRTRR